MSDTERCDAIPAPMRPRRPEDFDRLYMAHLRGTSADHRRRWFELADAGVIRGRVLDVGYGPVVLDLYAGG